MPDFGYSYQSYDPVVHVRSSAREIKVSHKAAREVCHSIKGMKLQKAKTFLEDVSELNRAVAFRRHKKEGAHRSGLGDFHTGKYPVKTAKKVLEVITNLESNAEFKGFDTEKLILVHASAHKGRIMRGFIPRAFGRSSPSNNTLVHLELVASEKK
jgi:large subunit ribosomal protein L22|tara:strand:- start:225 stop:689 length:465 start_codon:yes stop_codon:yes gene_type:complete